MTDDVRKLLGGYATGTLSEEEKQALYEAALSDDELFAAMADEQALKELLEDGAVRAQLLQATENPRFTVMGGLREWFDRPKAKALVGTAAVLLVVIGVRSAYETKPIGQGSPAEVAELRQAPVAPATTLDPTPQPRVAKRTQSSSDNSKPQAPKKPVMKYEEDRAANAPPPVTPASPPRAEVTESATLTAGNVSGIAGGAAGGVQSAPAPPPAPTKSLARQLRTPNEAAPAAMQMAAGGPFERAAGTTAVPLRYELLRRDAAGAFQPVPVDHEFADGDVVRVRVNSTQGGIVVLGVAGRSSETGGTVANVWATFPQTDGIVIGPETKILALRFTPMESTVSSFADTTVTSAKPAQTVSSSGVNLQIPIRRKSR